MTTRRNSEDETMTRRERERLAHRREIMDAALSVFAEKGYFGTTLDEIAQRADFSKGTLYLYFQSKEDLLYTIIKEKNDEWLGIMKNIMSKGLSFKEELRMFLRESAKHAFEDRRFLTLHAIHHTPAFKALSPERAAEFGEIHKRMEEISTEYIKKAIARGELRNIRPQALFGLLHGSIENMMITRWDCDTVKKLELAIDIYIDIIFNGIAKERETARET